MICYASSKDTLRRLSNPRAVKLKLFGTIFYDTGNFNERPSYLAGALEKQGANLEHVFLLAHNLRIDMKVREFYYKFICNRLATGEWLHRVGMTNSNVCTFCNCEKETVEHLFIKCDITKTFGEKYSEWRYNASGKLENLTTENITLAYPNYR